LLRCCRSEASRASRVMAIAPPPPPPAVNEEYYENLRSLGYIRVAKFKVSKSARTTSLRLCDFATLRLHGRNTDEKLALILALTFASSAAARPIGLRGPRGDEAHQRAWRCRRKGSGSRTP
jgi:hypothetical protein